MRPVRAGPTPWLDRYPQGQLVVRQSGSIALADAVRRRAAERGLYVETFLAADYPAADGSPLVVLVPLAGPLPAAEPPTLAGLSALLPAGSLVLTPDQLPEPAPRGTPATFAAVSALWERLHAPFLAAADAEVDPLRRMAAYRRTIAVDPGCEFAHQRLSATARELARQLARDGR